MAKVNFEFDISEEIIIGLISGKYIRTGGVIRDTAGRIVLILKDGVSNNSSEATANAMQSVDVASAAESAAKVAIKDGSRVALGKNIAMGALVVAGLTAAGIGTYKLVTYLKKHKEDNKSVEVLSENYVVFENNPELIEYFNNMQTQNMTLKSIREISKFFVTYSNGEVDIEITDEELKAIRNVIVRYTIKLCEVNEFGIENREFDTETSIKDANDLLEEILFATKIQEDVLTTA